MQTPRKQTPPATPVTIICPISSPSYYRGWRIVHVPSVISPTDRTKLLSHIWLS